MKTVSSGAALALSAGARLTVPVTAPAAAAAACPAGGGQRLRWPRAAPGRSEPRPAAACRARVPRRRRCAPAPRSGCRAGRPSRRGPSTCTASAKSPRLKAAVPASVSAFRLSGSDFSARSMSLRRLAVERAAVLHGQRIGVVGQARGVVGQSLTARSKAASGFVFAPHGHVRAPQHAPAVGVVGLLLHARRQALDQQRRTPRCRARAARWPSASAPAAA